MHGELRTVETGDRDMRLETRVLLDSGPERALEQQGIALAPRLGDRAPRRLFLVREGGGRPPDIAGPAGRHGRAFAGVDLLPPAAGKQDRRAGLAGSVRSDHAWQRLVLDFDCVQSGERGFSFNGGDRRDRLADKPRHPVVVEEGKGCDDAWNFARRRKIDGHDAGVCVR